MSRTRLVPAQLDLPHLAGRLVGVPLALSRRKLDAILAVVGPRFGLRAESPLPFALPGEEPDEPEEEAPVGLAVVPIHGTLVGRPLGLDALSGFRSYRDIAADLDAALADSNVQGILLEIDSGGGEVSGLFDLADRVQAARAVKPIYAVADEAAFSAAYALAASAERVFLPRTGGVGSVGVVALHVDESQADRQAGLTFSYVFAGDRKVDGNSHEPLSERARASLQAEVDRLYGLFVAHVAAARGLEPDAVRAQQAGLYFGEQAVEAGLADQVGTRDEALAALADAVRARREQERTNARQERLAGFRRTA